MLSRGWLFFPLLLGSMAGGLPARAADESFMGTNELTRLVRQDCGSCHGMLLTGGLGQALVPEALREKSFDSLVATVLYGRPGTAMPAWKTILSQRDAEWIVQKFISGFPEETK